MGQTFEDKTYGANLIAAFVGCVWLGLAWAVGGVYFLRFSNDRVWLKLLAGTMLLLATVDSCVIIARSYDSLINHYADKAYVFQTHWATGAIYALIGVSGLLLQSFFVYRIVVVSQRASALWRVYAGAVWLLSMASAGLSWYIAVWINTRHSLVEVVRISRVIYAYYACSIASEALGTVALVWFLVLKPRRENRSLNMGDNSLFVRLVRKTVETNALTLFWHTAGIVLVTEALQIGGWYSVAGQSLSKVYAISLFANLLSRSPDQGRFDRQSITQPTAAVMIEHGLSWAATEQRPSALIEGGLSVPTSAMFADRRRSSLVKFGDQLTPDSERKRVIGYDSSIDDNDEAELGERVDAALRVDDEVV